MEKRKSKLRMFGKTVLFLSVGMVFMLIVWMVVNVRPAVKDGQPLVEVSKELTQLEGPLDENGDVDYLEAVNQIYSEGVTPENNALVKIVEAMGPVFEGAPLEDEFFERIGIKKPPINGAYFVNFYDNLGVLGLNGQSTERTNMLADYDLARQLPWTPEDLPKIETWYQKNFGPAEIIREGIKRPRYYHPLICQPGEKPRLICARLSVVQSLRALARFFGLSLNRNLGTGNVDGALEDVLAIYRLGHHSMQGATLVEQLVGIAILQIGNDYVATICASEMASSQQLRDFLVALEEFKLVDNFQKTITTTEHFMILDSVVTVGREGAEGFGYLSAVMGGTQTEGYLTRIAEVGLKSVDWRECLFVVNHWHERFNELASIKNEVERLKAFEEFEKELGKEESDTGTPGNIVLTVLGGRRAKGRAMGDIMTCMLASAMPQVLKADVRSKAFHHMTRILVAITAFKKDNGKFPDDLDELTPKYLKSVPLDPFVQLPFKYSVDKLSAEDQGFESDQENATMLVPVLYSVGENGIDDSGYGVFTPATSGTGTFDDYQLQWTPPQWFALDE